MRFGFVYLPKPGPYLRKSFVHLLNWQVYLPNPFVYLPNKLEGGSSSLKKPGGSLAQVIKWENGAEIGSIFMGDDSK